MIRRCREQVGEAARRRKRVALRHVERETIFKHSAGVAKRQESILQGVIVDFAGSEAVRLIPQTGSRKVKRIFKEAVLGLKVLRGQVHPLGPYDLGKQL